MRTAAKRPVERWVRPHRYVRNGVKHETKELTGLALEFAVQKALGTFNSEEDGMQGISLADYIEACGGYTLYWDTCGPIIEREKITVFHDAWWEAGMKAEVSCSYGAASLDMDFTARGDTALVAAMRCFVISKMGAEVDL